MDAYFGYSAAAMAAAAEFQKQAANTGSSSSATASAFPTLATPFGAWPSNPMMMNPLWSSWMSSPWMQMMAPWMAMFGGGAMPGAGVASAPAANPFLPFAKPDFGSAFFQFAPTMMPSNPMLAAFQPARGSASTNFAAANDIMQAWRWAFPTMPWSMFEHPMTCMMMSSGVPHAVAAPTARANAASMDAAEAARKGFSQTYAHFNDGKEPPSSVINFWPNMMIAMMETWMPQQRPTSYR
ncbi:MAG: hypothetical protein ACRCS9_14565 [Hyphomicrobium sp.]